jgi:hypothetical protein
VPAQRDKQGIGWSIPLMNSNIYYFVLEVSIQGWWAAPKPTSGFLTPTRNTHESEQPHKSR